MVHFPNLHLLKLTIIFQFYASLAVTQTFTTYCRPVFPDPILTRKYEKQQPKLSAKYLCSIFLIHHARSDSFPAHGQV